MPGEPRSRAFGGPPHEAVLGALAGLVLWAGACAVEAGLDPAMRSFVALADHATSWGLAIAPLLGGGLGWIVGDRRREREEAFALYQATVDDEFAAIAEREWVTRAVVQNAFDAVLILDLEGRLLDANPTAARIFGHPLDDLVRMRIGDLLPDNARLRSGGTGVERRTAGGERLGVEWRARARHADGSAFPVDLHISLLSGPGLLVYAIREATTRLQHEQTLVDEVIAEHRGQAAIERQRRGSLLLDVSTGLHRELDGVLGAVGRLEGAGGGGDEVQALAAASRGLLERVDQLWNVTMWERAEAGNLLRPVGVAELLEAFAIAMQPRVRGREHRLVVRAAPDAGTLSTDASAVLCALRNLASEALRRSSDAAVVVEAVREPGRGTDWVAVFVHDDGPALSPEALAGVYQAFAAADSETLPVGEHAGLVLAQRLAKALGGHVAADSAEGHGTTYTLRLPLDAARVKEVSHKDPARPRSGGADGSSGSDSWRSPRPDPRPQPHTPARDTARNSRAGSR